jgi:hypothetical protein
MVKIAFPILSKSPFRAKYSLKTLRAYAERTGTRLALKSVSTIFVTILLQRPSLRWLSSTSNAKEFLVGKSPRTWASQFVHLKSACWALLKRKWGQVKPCVPQVVSLTFIDPQSTLGKLTYCTNQDLDCICSYPGFAKIFEPNGCVAKNCNPADEHQARTWINKSCGGKPGFMAPV